MYKMFRRAILAMIPALALCADDGCCGTGGGEAEQPVRSMRRAPTGTSCVMQAASAPIHRDPDPSGGADGGQTGGAHGSRFREEGEGGRRPDRDLPRCGLQVRVGGEPRQIPGGAREIRDDALPGLRPGGSDQGCDGEERIWRTDMVLLLRRLQGEVRRYAGELRDLSLPVVRRDRPREHGGARSRAKYDGREMRFCCDHCKAAFDVDPAAYFKLVVPEGGIADSTEWGGETEKSRPGNAEEDPGNNWDAGTV